MWNVTITLLLYYKNKVRVDRNIVLVIRIKEDVWPGGDLDFGNWRCVEDELENFCHTCVER
jgi:hypothetical protein